MMAKVIYRNGKILTEDGSGGWREPTKRELAEARISLPADVEQRVNDAMAEARAGPKPGSTPEAPVQEMGIDFVERMKLKNFANSPESARKYLVGLGYDVRPYGSGWNFAVRKDASDPWRVVDPDGGIFTSDIIYDLADLTVDTIQGYITSQATLAGAAAGSAISPGAGTLVGGMVAGGVAGAGTELARQKTGQMIGIPQEVDLAQAGTVGAVSAAIPGAGPVLRGVGKGISSAYGALKGGATEFAAQIAGAKPLGILSARDIFKARVSDVAGVLEKLPSFSKTVDDIYNAVGKIKSIPEIDEADSILGQLDVVSDLTPILDALSDLSRQSTAEAARQKIVSSALPSKAGQILDDIYTFLSKEGVQSTDEVPLSVAVTLKSTLQDVANGLGAYKDQPIDQPIRDAASNAARATRLAIERLADDSGVTGPSGKAYSELMADGAEKTRMLKNMKRALGINLSKETGRERAELYLASIFGMRRSTRMSFAREFTKRFGIQLELPVLRSVIGTKIGDEGVPALLPALGTGLAARTAAPVVGAMGINPRNLVRGARLGTGAERVISSVATPVAHGTQAVLGDPKSKAAIAALMQELARQGQQPTPRRQP